MKKVFISGSIKIKNLTQSVRTRLQQVIQKGYVVLIGDADGVDKAVQEELADNGYRNVVVYCSGVTCRNNQGTWSVVKITPSPNAKGRKFYMAKDEAMADAADHGLLIWDGKSAGTINNLLNLVKNKKTGLIYLQHRDSFRTISNISEFEVFISECDSKNAESIDRKISFRKKLKDYQLPVQEQLEFTAVSEPQEKKYSTNTGVNKTKTKKTKKNAAQKKQDASEN